MQNLLNEIEIFFVIERSRNFLLHICQDLPAPLGA